MKNHFSKLALTAALALAIALTLGCEEKKGSKPAEQAVTAPKEDVASCKEGEKVKLLESITKDNGITQKFEYDDKNRIVKINAYESKKISSTQTITYNSDNLVTVVGGTDTTKYVIKGNTITSKSVTLTINKDGYIAKTETSYGWSYTYEYKDGNQVGIDGKSDDGDFDKRNYTYDDRKSPFSNSNTPKWLIQNEFSRNGYANKNNVLAISFNSSNQGEFGSDYKYEYDSEGFPTKETEEGGGGEFVDEYKRITSYTYRTADCKGGAK